MCTKQIGVWLWSCMANSQKKWERRRESDASVMMLNSQCSPSLQFGSAIHVIHVSLSVTLRGTLGGGGGGGCVRRVASASPMFAARSGNAGAGAGAHRRSIRRRRRGARRRHVRRGSGRLGARLFARTRRTRTRGGAVAATVRTHARRVDDGTDGRRLRVRLRLRTGPICWSGCSLSFTTPATRCRRRRRRRRIRRGGCCTALWSWRHTRRQYPILALEFDYLPIDQFCARFTQNSQYIEITYILLC